MHQYLHNNSPIFVVGTPRSGTTLTAKILGRHSNIFMPGETHFFDDIYSRKNELGRLGDQRAQDKTIELLLSLYGRYNEPKDQERVNHLVKEHGFKDKILESTGTYVDLLSSFMRIQAEFSCKKRWGNNAPRDIFNIDEIIEFYNDVKIILCVRDVRDFLLSYQGKWRTTSEKEVERLKKLYHPVVTSLLWKSSMKRIPEIRKKVPEKNLIIIKYENLVSYPEKTIKKICNTIEEDYESSMLEVNASNSSHGKGQKGIFSTSVGRWESLLSKEEVCIAQSIASKEIQSLGYPMTDPNANLLKMAAICATAPYAFWRGLSANSKKRGAIGPYLLKRILSLFN